MQRIILVHYHEIGLKGHNRSTFEKRLLTNIKKLASMLPVSDLKRISGRILVIMEADCSRDDQIGCASFIARIPGVARVSCGFLTDRDMGDITECAIEALGECHDAATFKVQARRAHTDFPVDSMTMNREVGAVLCSGYPDLRVKMKDPDVIVGIEVIQGSAYVYAFSERGIGGLPVGVSGRLACLLSTGIDSPVAVWRMARRGASCFGIHFSGAPETSDASEYLVRDISQVLAETGCLEGLKIVRFGEYQRWISLDAPSPLRIILYRRLMMRTAAAFAGELHCGALVTGESLGQVASQTLDNIRCTDAAVDMPVFRPLIGTDKQEIIQMAHELGTFDLSTTDSPDCCTLFMPKAPETHANLADVEEAEAIFPVEDWVSEMVSTAESVSFRH